MQAVYAEDQKITGSSNMTAIALAMEGSPIEQNSAGETLAYKRGFQEGTRVHIFVSNGEILRHTRRTSRWFSIGDSQRKGSNSRRYTLRPTW